MFPGNIKHIHKGFIHSRYDPRLFLLLVQWTVDFGSRFRFRTSTLAPGVGMIVLPNRLRGTEDALVSGNFSAKAWLTPTHRIAKH